MSDLSENKKEAIVKWDLSELYQSLDDPQIEKDTQKCIALMQKFHGFKGLLSEKLGQVLELSCDIEKLETKLGVYAYLEFSTQVDNPETMQLRGKISEALSAASAEYMNYFSHEIVALPDAVYTKLLKSSEIVMHHKPMLDDIRDAAKYLLPEEVEQALSMRSPFGSGEWDEFCDEMEADLNIEMSDKSHTLTEALHILSEGEDPKEREEALKAINLELGKQYVKFRARALNMVIGEKAVNDKQRGFKKPISSRNYESKLEDSTVDALHDAVRTKGAEECQRFYKLKFALLDRKGPQSWAHRNANMPFASKEYVSWAQTKEGVLEAYASFSPKLAELIQTIFNNNWVDVHPYKGKSGGAYNASGVYPDGIRSYNFLNHQGSVSDVMTAAHELGHGVHGMLAGEAQGPLMWHAPMVYAETASIFGEMITFEYMLSKIDDDQERLALLMGKLDDFMNTVVRQINFSVFEQTIHDMRKGGKLSVEDFSKVWMDSTIEFYGKDGDVFKYEDMDRMWSYVGHFMRPFYVYAYAFGELFTQSLFAVKDNFGDKFEPMYLDLLRKGGTEGAVDLMKPFGLNPNDPDFWLKGIACSATKWLDEAEVLSKKLKLIS
jgi:oligoendopeptidase F